MRTIATSNSLYVKVSMDGTPYLRKMDLKMYSTYHDLSSALQKMFNYSITMGKSGSTHESNKSNLMDHVLNGSEYVPTFEDKDGNWMLVGDVPWQIFVDSCQGMRIMKASEAIGLAPRAMGKCKNRNEDSHCPIHDMDMSGHGIRWPPTTLYGKSGANLPANLIST